MLFLAWVPGLAAPDSKPSPLGKRELFVRGSFNNWAAEDETRLRLQCNGRYELVAAFPGQFTGEVEFKIADEDWSNDANFGGTLAQLQRKGPALKYRFSGLQKLVFDMSGSTPTLSITPCTGCKPTAATPDVGVSNPVARSLRFDSRAAGSKAPIGAVTLNPERDSIIKTHLAGNHNQPLAA